MCYEIVFFFVAAKKFVAEIQFCVCGVYVCVCVCVCEYVCVWVGNIFARILSPCSDPYFKVDCSVALPAYCMGGGGGGSKDPQMYRQWGN